MKKIERKTHVLDASGQVVGRLASRISIILQGKHKPEFAPNLDAGDIVEVQNIGEIRFTGKKMEQKIYRRHSGYLGGLKEIPVSRVWEKSPSDVLRAAVRQMLPKNRLSKARMKRLIISH